VVRDRTVIYFHAQYANIIDIIRTSCTVPAANKCRNRKRNGYGKFRFNFLSIHFETLMFCKYRIPIALFIQAMAGCFLVSILSCCSETTPLETVMVQTKEISVVTSTNGIIEPIDSTRIFASVDGFIQSIECSEGSETKRGQILFRMDAPQTRIALAEANAALLETKRQARVVLEGPLKEELDSLDATIQESKLQLQQLNEKLSGEETLLEKGAVSVESVESLREQRDLLELRSNALKKKKENLLTRYSEEDKQLMRDKINELSNQAGLLEQQVQI